MSTAASAECPTCGEGGFDKEADMKIHHKLSHGESLAYARVTCARCGESDQIPDAWDRKKERHFCSTQCRSEWMSANRTGGDSPVWKGGKETVQCGWCDERFQMWPSEIAENDRHFCSRQCLARRNRETFRGDNSPRWKGGWEHYGGPNWQEQRDEALARDDHSCVVCSAGEEGIGREPDVHHIRPRRMFVDADGDFDHEEANRLSNLVVLCPPCHREWEGIPLHPNTAQPAD